MQDRLGIPAMSKDKPNRKRRARKKRQLAAAASQLPPDEVSAARERGRKLAEEANDGIALQSMEHPPGAIEKIAAALPSLEQNESGDELPGVIGTPGHMNEDINEPGLMDQIAKEEEQRDDYYARKAKKNDEMMPYLFWMFVVTIIGLLGYFFWQLIFPT